MFLLMLCIGVGRYGQLAFFSFASAVLARGPPSTVPERELVLYMHMPLDTYADTTMDPCFESILQPIPFYLDSNYSSSLLSPLRRNMLP